VKLYEIIINPASGFGTPLKGDTLFGHVCWQAGDDPDLFDKELPELIRVYHKTPFAVFSSAFPFIAGSPADETPARYVLKKPEMPMSKIFPQAGTRLQTLKQIKENKQKKWMVVPRANRIDMADAQFLTDEAVCRAISATDPDRRQSSRMEKNEAVLRSTAQAHTTINRLTGTTGTGMFAPYEKENFFYFPGTRLALLVLVDTDLVHVEPIVKTLERIGKWGFGRDASTGMGKFTIASYVEMPGSTETGFLAGYTLAPCVPDTELLEKFSFKSFARFGKHGAFLATSRNPFKNPVIMADEAAVLWPKDTSFFKKPYLGKSVSGVSKTMPETVVQGYSPYLPLKLEPEI